MITVDRNLTSSSPALRRTKTMLGPTKASVCGSFLALVTLLLQSSSLLAAPSDRSNLNAEGANPQAWQVHLTFQKPSYPVGADPMLMITVVNRSEAYEALPNLPIWEVTQLEIIDHNGSSVKPLHHPHRGWMTWSGGITHRFAPAESVARRWGAQTFLPLSYWGYELGPGDYNIVARLMLADWKTFVPSNAVHLWIHG
jgi:hypothetical protein